MSKDCRISYFDWIRGLMILWMLVYHISLNYGIIEFGVPENGYSLFTFMSFFMATFYVASGYFFNPNKEFKPFLINKIKKIVVPYVTFSIWGVIIFEIYSFLTFGHFNSLELQSSLQTGCLRANTPLWFFFSLFACNILYFGLSRFLGGKTVHVLVLLCFFMAYFTCNRSQLFGYGNILLGIPCFHIGYYLNKYKRYLLNPLCAIIALFLFFTIGFLAPQRLEFVRNILVQGDFFLNFVFSIVACYCLWYISQLWNHNNLIGRGIINIGLNSLVVYAAHRPILNWVIEPVLRKLYPSVSYYEFLIICLVSLIGLCFLLNALLKTYTPLLIGEKAK